MGVVSKASPKSNAADPRAEKAGTMSAMILMANALRITLAAPNRSLRELNMSTSGEIPHLSRSKKSPALLMFAGKFSANS